MTDQIEMTHQPRPILVIGTWGPGWGTMRAVVTGPAQAQELAQQWQAQGMATQLVVVSVSYPNHPELEVK